MGTSIHVKQIEKSTPLIVFQLQSALYAIKAGLPRRLRCHTPRAQPPALKHLPQPNMVYT